MMAAGTLKIIVMIGLRARNMNTVATRFAMKL
jgi:hypothetical protein